MLTFHNDFLEYEDDFYWGWKLSFSDTWEKKEKEEDEVFLSQGNFSGTICCIMTLNSV